IELARNPRYAKAVSPKYRQVGGPRRENADHRRGFCLLRCQNPPLVPVEQLHAALVLSPLSLPPSPRPLFLLPRKSRKPLRKSKSAVPSTAEASGSSSPPAGAAGLGKQLGFLGSY
ncbi:hypothetical protein U9M48_026976, partial [Paspalum notatum var. saurae]